MKRRILIVEKDKGIREVLDYLLTDEGFDVKSFSHLDGIINHIEEYDPQIILFDIVVPGVEDSDICRLIKTSKPRSTYRLSFYQPIQRLRQLLKTFVRTRLFLSHLILKNYWKLLKIR